MSPWLHSWFGKKGNLLGSANVADMLSTKRLTTACEPQGMQGHPVRSEPVKCKLQQRTLCRRSKSFLDPPPHPLSAATSPSTTLLNSSWRTPQSLGGSKRAGEKQGHRLHQTLHCTGTVLQPMLAMLFRHIIILPSLHGAWQSS